MTRDARVLRAFLVAPLAAPILYWATSFVAALVDPSRRGIALQAPLAGLAVILAVGGLVAYVATLVIGVPAYWFLRRRGRVTLGWLVFTGAGTGLVTALFLQPYLRGELFSVLLTPVQGMALGAAAGAVLWWLSPRSAPSEADPP